MKPKSSKSKAAKTPRVESPPLDEQFADAPSEAEPPGLGDQPLSPFEQVSLDPDTDDVQVGE